MLRDARSRDRETKSEGENTNPSNHTTTTNNNNSTNSHHPQTEKTLDGDDFNVINREEADDVDEVEEEEEADSEEEQHSFYRPGLAGLLGGRMMQRSSRSAPGKFDHLHPFTQVLSVSNVDDCVELEAEAFPENERCSREKVG